MARWHKVEQFQHFLFRSKNFNPRTFFNSESVKDITSSHTFFSQKFNHTSIKLQGGVRSKQCFEVFSTLQASIPAKICSQSTRQIYEFLDFKKGEKNYFSCLPSKFFCHFGITTQQDSKARKKN